MEAVAHPVEPQAALLARWVQRVARLAAVHKGVELQAAGPRAVARPDPWDRPAALVVKAAQLAVGIRAAQAAVRPVAERTVLRVVAVAVQ